MHHRRRVPVCRQCNDHLLGLMGIDDRAWTPIERMADDMEGRRMAKQQAKMTKRAALEMIARDEAAEKAGVPMTEENLKKLGYVPAKGGGWELPIPPAVLKIIADQRLKADTKSLTAKQASLVKRLTAAAAHRVVELDELKGLPFSIRCKIISAVAKGIEDRMSKK